jgi:hypothetical protein
MNADQMASVDGMNEVDGASGNGQATPLSPVVVGNN